jgi:hypothetical protein
MKQHRQILIVIAQDSCEEQSVWLARPACRRRKPEAQDIDEVRYDLDVPANTVRGHLACEGTAYGDHGIRVFEREPHFESIARRLHKRAERTTMLSDDDRAPRPPTRKYRSKSCRQCYVCVNNIAPARSNLCDDCTGIIEVMNETTSRKADTNYRVAFCRFQITTCVRPCGEHFGGNDRDFVLSSESARLFGNEDARKSRFRSRKP